MGLLESAAQYYPDAEWQRCIVHFYRNVFSFVPKGKRTEVARMLKAIHAQEDKNAALEKGKQVVASLKAKKLPKAADLVERVIAETSRITVTRRVTGDAYVPTCIFRYE